MTRLLGVVVISCLLGGCASSQVDAHGYSKRSYLGWIEVSQYTQPAKVVGSKTTVIETKRIPPRIERVKTIGIRIQNGFSIGYFDDSVIELPMECHLVIVVKEPAQLDHIFAAYPKLAKELKPCVKPLDY
jgi:hypothetical protein